MAITNPDEVITAQDLADYHNTILPYLGGNLPVMGQINKSDIYDTTEKVVGKWIDGRPLYQISLDLSSKIPSATGNTTYELTQLGTNINDIFIVPEATYVYQGDLAKLSLHVLLTNNSSGAVSAQWMLYVFKVTSETYAKISFSQSADGGVTKLGYVTVRYTKTTDAVNSFNYAPENDYSTEETIIGKWIDGKTLFQRTWTGTLPSNLTNGSIVNLVTGFSYGSYIKKMDALYDWGSGIAQMPTASIGSSGTGTNLSLTVGINMYSEGTNIVTTWNGSVVSNYASRPYWITIQYTKS